MAADEFAWNMSEMTSQFQQLVRDTNLAAATCHKWINDYYRNHFPEDSDVELLKGWLEQSTSATDSGKYSLGQTVLKLEEPVFRDDVRIKLVLNSEKFFSLYSDDEQYITTPALAIGTDDKTKVKCSDFTYRISGYGYSKLSTETAFSGLSTVPQNKYGAFSLKIDDDGDITIAEADNNSTGYDTLAEAVEGLNFSDSDTAYMGYVTVISTDFGGFIPGTTSLDDAAVTDTYTDGDPGNRGEPETVCIYQEYLYVRPKAYDIYLIKAPKIIRPDAIDTGSPLDYKWGPCIAAGAARYYALEILKNKELASEIAEAWQVRINSIRGKNINQLMESTIQRSFI